MPLKFAEYQVIYNFTIIAVGTVTGGGGHDPPLLGGRRIMLTGPLTFEQAIDLFFWF